MDSAISSTATSPEHSRAARDRRPKSPESITALENPSTRDSSVERELSRVPGALPRSTYNSEIVTLHVGTSSPPDVFRIHQTLLTKSSTFFKACLSADHAFSEARTSTISLPDFAPATFAHYSQYLYSGGNLAHEGLSARPPQFFLLVRLWKLSKFLGDEELGNKVVDVAAQVSGEQNAVLGVEDVSQLWDGEEGLGRQETGFEKGWGKEKGLRGLAVDMMVGKKTRMLLRADDGWHEAFLKDVIEVMRVRMDVPGVPVVHMWEDDTLRCAEYHEHRMSEPCHKWAGDIEGER